MQSVFHISLIAEKFKCYEADLEERKTQQLLGTELIQVPGQTYQCSITEL